MKKLFLILMIAFTASNSFAQFTDSSHLNDFIRDTIKDRRPGKITATDLQRALLGISNLVPVVTNDTSFIAAKNTEVPSASAVKNYITKTFGNLANNDSVVHRMGTDTISGTKFFNSSPTIPTPVNTDSSKNASTTAYVKNVVSAYFKLPALTNGSPVFYNGTTLAEDNSNYFWDNVNKRIGIGTKTPASPGEFRANGGANNSPSVIMTYNNRTVGTAANGSGVVNQWKSQSDAAYDRLMAQQWVTWADATDATRRAQWVDYLMNPSGGGIPVIIRVLQPDMANAWVGVNMKGLIPQQALQVHGKTQIDTIPTGNIADALVTVHNSVLSQIPAATFVQPSTLLVDTVQTIAALENYVPGAKTSINTIVVKDDKRGGVFSHVTTGTPDSITVFSCVSGGYWKRQFKGDYHVLWAGADNTSTFDNTVIINYLLATGLPDGSTLYIDAGNYKDTGLVIPTGRTINITGAGRVSSGLICSGLKPALTFGSGVSDVKIKDLTLSGNGSGSYGAGATNGNGVVFNANVSIYFENVRIIYNGGYGVYADSSGNTNNIYFNNCLISKNAKSAVRMIGTDGYNQVNAIYFNQSSFSDNGQNGMELWGVSFDVNGCDIENNAKRGIIMSSSMVSGTYTAYNISIDKNHFEGNDSGFIFINSNNIIYGLEIRDNYGLYDTTSASVHHAGINLCELASPAFTTYANSVFRGFIYANNKFYEDPSAVNSYLNGNNVLSNSSTIQPTTNSDLSMLKNLGAALILYTPSSSTDSSNKTQTTAGSRQLNAAIQTQLKAKADTGSTTVYVKAPLKIDTVSNPGHITITLDTSNMPGLRPYKVYTALLSQTDTTGTAPTATVLENTTGYTFSYTYSGVGWYTVTASGSVFTAGHSYVLLQNQAYTTISIFEYTTASTTAISLHVRRTDGTPINGSLSGEIEIRVYP